jgi:hypothetical protein
VIAARRDLHEPFGLQRFDQHQLLDQLRLVLVTRLA